MDIYIRHCKDYSDAEKAIDWDRFGDVYSNLEYTIEKLEDGTK